MTTFLLLWCAVWLLVLALPALYTLWRGFWRAWVGRWLAEDVARQIGRPRATSGDLDASTERFDKHMTDMFARMDRLWLTLPPFVDTPRSQQRSPEPSCEACRMVLERPNLTHQQAESVLQRRAQEARP